MDSTMAPPDPATRVEPPAAPIRLVAVPPFDAVAADGHAVARAAWLMVIAGVGAAIGSLLPWGRVTTFLGTIAIEGTHGDGKLTLLAGVFVAAVGVLVLLSRASYHLVVLGLVGCCAVVAVTGYNALDLTVLSGEHDVLGVVDVAYGLWLTLAAGVAGILGGALLIQRP
jgi:hypothetical protein